MPALEIVYQFAFAKRQVNVVHTIDHFFLEPRVDIEAVARAIRGHRLGAGGIQDKESLLIMAFKMPLPIPTQAPDKIIIDAFLQEIKQQGAFQADDAKMTKIGGIKAIEMTGTKNIKGEDAKMLSYSFLRSEKIFSFSFLTSKKSFSSKMSKFKKIGKTIKFQN